MKLEKFESNTIKKIKSYVENKSQFLGKFERELVKKQQRLAELEARLAEEEQLFLVEFNSNSRKKIDEMKKEIIELKSEIEEDKQFKLSASNKTLILTEDDYKELETVSSNIAVKHYKLFDNVLEKKNELIQAIMEFDKEYAELYELQEEIKFLCLNSEYNSAQTGKILSNFKIITPSQIKDIANEITALVQSIPISKPGRRGILVKALTDFAGRVTMKKGEYMVILDKKIADDLIKSEHVVKIN